MDYRQHPWMGVFPATLCAFHEDERIDEDGLRAYFRELIAVDGLKGMVCNGHTGEIMSLRLPERARVTQLLAEEMRASRRALKVISGVAGEGSLTAIDEATAAKESGADAILLMPPHHWLRFGRSSAEAVGFCPAPSPWKNTRPTASPTTRIALYAPRTSASGMP